MGAFMFDGIDGTHRSHFAAAIDALSHPSAVELNEGAAEHAASHLHWRDLNGGGRACRGVVTLHVEAVATVSAAVNVAVDGTTVDNDDGAVENGTELTAAVHIAPDGATGEVHLGLLYVGQAGPNDVDGAVEFDKTTLCAAKHVAANGMGECRLSAVADGTATDVNGSYAFHRAQTAATINGAEQGALLEVDGGVAFDIASGSGPAGEATTGAEDVAIQRRSAPSADADGIIRHIDGDRHVAEDVAVFAAAVDGSEDSASGDLNFGFTNVGPIAEHGARIAHAAAENHVDDRVVHNVLGHIGHTHGATRHLDGGFA